MNVGWIVLGIVVIMLVGAAMPLLRKNHPSNRPLPPPKETLRDWRKES